MIPYKNIKEKYSKKQYLLHRSRQCKFFVYFPTILLTILIFSISLSALDFTIPYQGYIKELGVSISGNYAVIGATGDDDNGRSTGSVYIFKRNGDTWVEHTKLTSSEGQETSPYGNQYFGSSVSISGDYVVIGDYADNNFCGSAYIFKREGEMWIIRMYKS